MISVLIPTKGRPGMLREALRSLQAQTFPHWEAVVAEDGEGEGLEVVSALADPRVRGLRNPGRGQVEARMAALRESRGEAVLFLDDDDLLLDPAYLYRAWRALAQGAGVVYGEGVLLLADQEVPFAPGQVGPWLLKDNRLLASGTAVRKKLLLDLGGLDPAMGDYWDWDLWLRAYRAGVPFRYLKGRGVGVRVHGANQSYGARREERALFLERLRVKHGLEPVPLKDHLQLALESNSVS
ncbi:glycosyltransferase family 2 protein [Thermus tengchongensis]|uniref:Glycosyltransferase family 2 protein n=2 Tax=Thermus tengchongensis TaxID=1214928 RepID=A0A4Y9ET61_9DEIN|nr:glycosyltransferase family 2 protein [Thermus tengchongensis]TFU14208.1 glycosyltransferase family 2 protein [Thermus tengchongensis]TFU25191.1 glycosyltransferase family 2 protein [Thermus tengchongensis]